LKLARQRADSLAPEGNVTEPPPLHAPSSAAISARTGLAAITAAKTTARAEAAIAARANEPPKNEDFSER
jgi:hypothetical protein